MRAPQPALLGHRASAVPLDELVARAAGSAAARRRRASRWSPRRTTTAGDQVVPGRRRRRARRPARPSSVARSIQRGPLMPMTRDGWVPVRPSSVFTVSWQMQLGAEAALALGGGAAALGEVGGDLAAGPRSTGRRRGARRRRAARRRPRRRRASRTGPPRSPRRPGAGARGPRRAGSSSEPRSTRADRRRSSGGRRRRRGPVASGASASARRLLGDRPRRARRPRRTCDGTSQRHSLRRARTVAATVRTTEASSRTVAPVASDRVGEFLDLDEPGPLEPLDDQLGDPVAAAQLDRLARVVVDQHHLDLAAVAGVDGARGVHDRQPVPGGQAGARVHQRDVPRRAARSRSRSAPSPAPPAPAPRRRWSPGRRRRRRDGRTTAAAGRGRAAAPAPRGRESGLGHVAGPYRHARRGGQWTGFRP